MAGLITFAIMAQPLFFPKAKPSLLQYVTGKYLQPSNCKVLFEWEDPKTVGETFVFTVEVRYVFGKNVLAIFTN